MKVDDFRAMAIEAGLDPDLWGHERAFEQFVALLEMRFKREHSGVCLKMHEMLLDKSSRTNSSYTRTVLRAKAKSLLIASRLI